MILVPDEANLAIEARMIAPTLTPIVTILRSSSLISDLYDMNPARRRAHKETAVFCIVRNVLAASDESLLMRLPRNFSYTCQPPSFVNPFSDRSSKKDNGHCDN